MSAGNVTSITEGAARRARKSVSFYDKMEEARARREEVLSRRPANISSAAPQAPGRTKPAERPLSRVEQSAPDALPIEAPAEETPAAVPEAVAAGQTVKWTIRALSLTLVILIGIALFRTEAQPPAVPPEFSPPQVSLTSQAFGPPLLASISHRTDRAVRSVERVTLAAAAPGSAPAGSCPDAQRRSARRAGCEPRRLACSAERCAPARTAAERDASSGLNPPRPEKWASARPTPLFRAVAAKRMRARAVS